MNQGHQRAFARPGRPYNRHVFPGADVYIDVFQHIHPRNIMEVHVLKPDFPLNLRQFLRIRFVFHFRLQIQHFKDADTRRHRPLQLAVLHCQVADGFKEPLNPQGEGHQHPRLQIAPARHQPPGQHHPEPHRQTDKHLYDRLQRPRKPAGFQIGVQVFGIQLVKVRHIPVLTIETLHHPNPGNVLVVLPVDHRDRPPDSHKGMPRKLLPVPQNQKQRRHDAQADQSQLPVNDQHHYDDADQTQQVGKALDNQLKGFLQLQHIALAARHYPPHRRPVIERRRHFLQMVEHLGPQGIQNPLPHPRHKDELRVVG